MKNGPFASRYYMFDVLIEFLRESPLTGDDVWEGHHAYVPAHDVEGAMASVGKYLDALPDKDCKAYDIMEVVRLGKQAVITPLGMVR